MQVSVYRADETSCAALDPARAADGPRVAPLDSALWRDRDETPPPRLRAPRGSGTAVIEVQCRDADEVVRLWGCADNDGSVEITLEPACATGGCAGCAWPCPAGAVPRWNGGEVCVQATGDPSGACDPEPCTTPDCPGGDG